MAEDKYTEYKETWRDVEAWGRGIQDMCQECVDYGCPSPHYIDSPNTVMLCLEAHPETIRSQRNAQSSPKSEQECVVGDVETTRKGGQKGRQKGGQKGGQKGEYSFFVEGQKISIDKSSTYGCMIHMMIEDPFVTQAAIVKELKVSRSLITKNTDKLKAYGILKRIGPDRGGYWECIAPEAADGE